MSRLTFASATKFGAFMLIAAATAPASAFTTFAQFNQATPDDVAVYLDLGASAAFSLIPSAVFFDVLAWGPVGTYSATITGSATTNQPFIVNGPAGSRSGWSGSLSFDDGGTNYLTVTFTDAVLFGTIGGTSAAFLASTPSSMISYASDIMDVSNLSIAGFALGISGLSPTFGSGSATYSGELTGGFAGGVPEPATWAMLVAGFGLIGTIARRRRQAHFGHIAA